MAEYSTDISSKSRAYNFETLGSLMMCKKNDAHTARLDGQDDKHINSHIKFHSLNIYRGSQNRTNKLLFFQTFLQYYLS